MKRLLPLICFSLIQFSIIQASDQVQIEYVSSPPIIDGVIDALWNDVTELNIDKDFQEEEPTVNAYWKAVWDDEYIYILIDVIDDDHWPGWVSGGDWYLYDQTEVYLDINDTLADGRGIADEGTGHYQAVGKFGDGLAGYKNIIEIDERRPEGFYSYTMDGENYTIEYALQISSMINIAGDTIDVNYLQELDSIGFDVCVIDQDEGETEARQRAVWENDGTIDESYVIMDQCGSIKLIGGSGNHQHKIQSNFNVYPNPAKNTLSILGEYTYLEIFNQLGQRFLFLDKSQEIINISSLPNGIYFVKISDKNNKTSVSKLIKK